MIFLIFDVLCVVLALLFIITQLFAPLIRGIPLFPLFRPNRDKVEEDILELNEKMDIARLEIEKKQLEKKLEEIRK